MTWRSPSAVERAVGFIEATGHAHGVEHPVLHTLSAESRLVVSEPLGDLAGVWNEVPESSCGIVQHGEDELRPFTPRSA